MNSKPSAPTNHQHEQWQIEEGALGTYCTACGQLVADDATRASLARTAENRDA